MTADNEHSELITKRAPRSSQNPKRDRILAYPQGTRIADKYQLSSLTVDPASGRIEPLGEGGSGVVYVADQTLYPGVSVRRAIKFYVFSDKIAAQTTHMRLGPISDKAFKDEIANLSSFNHQNILKVIEAGLVPPAIGEGEIPYVVTEYIDGFTLEQAINEHRLEQDVLSRPYIIIDLILQMCEGLAHLHSRDFFHCDIAPKNLFIRREGGGLSLVIGDLGVGRTLRRDGDAPSVAILGSKDYCPPQVRRILNTEVSMDQFRQLQPHWDIFALAKTGLELLEACNSVAESHFAWADALRQTLNDAIAGRRFTSVQDLATRVTWLHPRQYITWEVPELNDRGPDTQRRLLPVHAVALSPRIRQIANHPALLRLKKVPQLVMGTRLGQLSSHTRYEHSLGTYQTTRQYIAALLNDDEFIAEYSPRGAEMALVAALLSSVTRFPFSTIIHEIHSKDRKRFAQFSRSHILDELLSTGPKDDEGRPLGSVIEKQFPNISLAQLKQLLCLGAFGSSDPEFRFTNSLLNSSIDARVLDYLRRDYLHIGLARGDVFDLDELLPHIRYRNGQLVVRSTGMGAVEQIIALRYWIFNRVYWNQSNRAMIAMMKMVLLKLEREKVQFASGLRNIILDSSEEGVLRFLCEEARGMPAIEELCGMLNRMRSLIFWELVQFNRSEGDAKARILCDNIAALTIDDFETLHNEVNSALISQFELDPRRIHLLIDIPVEPGRKKLGEDINVLKYLDELKALAKLSGIVEGTQKGFDDHIQRLRIFINPAHHKLDKSRVDAIRHHVVAQLMSMLT